MIYDVIVVGLGAMGSATIRHLAARGARVLGLDQYEPPHTLGSSHGESRIIREAYFEHPSYVPLVQRAYVLWDELARDIGNADLLRLTGGLMLGADTSELITGTRLSAERHGLPIETLSNAELRRRFPQFSLTPGFTAIFDLRAGFLNPEACVAAHLTLAARDGAVLHTSEQVTGWSLTSDGVRVETTRGHYEAGRLVLSAGAWLTELLSARTPSLVVERQTLIWFDPPGERAQWEASRFPIYMCEFDDGQFIYGFPLGLRGWKSAVHYQGDVVADVRTMRRTVGPSDIDRVRNAVARLFPWAEHAPVRDSAVCPYTDTRDLHFIIDFLPGEPRVLVSSPCSGHGFKFASAVGEVQAQLLLDGQCDFDLSLFRMDR